MKDTPLLMCAEMVRATLEDRKHQTRRVMTKMLVDVPRKVRADIPSYGTLAPGRHKAVMNKLGAVSCDLGNGKLLGLKPGEFDWVCPYCEGETECTESGWVIRPRESRLWVRETWQCYEWLKDKKQGPVCYRATHEGRCCKIPGHLWRPSIFMPRWASRISLEVVSVRVQRVQAISGEDAQAEGIEFNQESSRRFYKHYAAGCHLGYLRPQESFRTLWDSINAKRAEGKYAWSANPWLWAITFKRV